MPTFTCRTCGKRFERPWYPSRNKPVYCSSNCHKNQRVRLVCQICGKDFRVPPSRSNQKYCSRACADEAQKRPKRHCLQCDQLYRPTNPSNVGYCSIQCSANARKATRLHKTCEWCSTEFVVKKGYTEARFCSLPCANKANALSGPDNPNWRGGSVRYRGPNWTSQATRARRRDNWTCQHCGFYHKGRPVLDVHHIVPFREFADYREANRLSNLTTLCKSCHHAIEIEYYERNELGQFR